jgi:hypothetical protein
MSMTFLAALCLIALATFAQAQTHSAEDQLTYSRAVQAAIWGMPAVNADLMRQEMLTKTDGKVNQVVYWSRPLDWHNQTLTPNPDAIYFVVFFDTKDVGPIVFEIPPGDANASLTGNIDTVWQTALEDVGLNGVDKGAGGKFVILPPDFAAKLPAEYTLLPSNTYTGFALLRSNLKSHSDADVAASVAYGKRVKVYPLSQADNPPETVFIDVQDVDYDSTIRYDASFFENLERVVQHEPWIERDRAMIDQLRTIGIEKGKPFAPSEATQKILAAAMDDVKTLLEERYNAGFPAFFPNSHWMFPTLQESIEGQATTYADHEKYAVDARAALHLWLCSDQTTGDGAVLSGFHPRQGRRGFRRRKDLSLAGAAECAGRAVLVSDRV